MTFKQYTRPAPSDVGQLTLRFSKTKENVYNENGDLVAEFVYAARFQVELIDGNGARLSDNVRGDLLPHLTAAQVNALKGLIDDLYSKAQAEIIP